MRALAYLLPYSGHLDRSPRLLPVVLDGRRAGGHVRHVVHLVRLRVRVRVRVSTPRWIRSITCSGDAPYSYMPAALARRCIAWLGLGLGLWLGLGSGLALGSLLVTMPSLEARYV